MRGTSAQSLREVLRGARTQFRSAQGALEGIADDLFSVAAAIDASNQLVRRLSDAGIPSQEKQGTARQLFSGRISERALDLVLDVVGRRWSEQEDVLDALEDLGVLALLEQADAEGVLGTVEEELFQYSRTIENSPALSEAYDDAREDEALRRSITQSLLGPRTHRVTVLLATQAVGRGTEEKPARRVRRFAEVASDRRRRLLAVVTSARPLSEQQSERLRGTLSRIYGRDVQLNVEVSRDVVGGLRIQVGDDLFDATVLARLAQARHRLAS